VKAGVRPLFLSLGLVALNAFSLDRMFMGVIGRISSGAIYYAAKALDCTPERGGEEGVHYHEWHCRMFHGL
jgi:hypothetical protein